MPAVTKVSPFSDNVIPTAYGDCAGEVTVNEFYVDITAAQNVAGNMFDVGILPSYGKVVDMILAPDDLDTGTVALTLDVGIMSGTPGDATSVRTMGAEFFSASTAGQAGLPARMTLLTGFRVQATEADRSIGVKIVTGPNVAAAGRIRVIVFSTQSNHKIAY